MSELQDVLEASGGMDTPAFLRYLIKDRFPGKVAATASLRARSIVVLRLIADIDPNVPVIFCHVKDVYPESLKYRAMIVGKLGLTDVREPLPDSGMQPGDSYHCESLWGEHPTDYTRRYTTIGLNESLKGFDCFISAVYHGAYAETPKPRAVQEGHLIRVDPLVDWSKDRVRGFLKKQDLPYHPNAMQRLPRPARPEAAHVDAHHY